MAVNGVLQSQTQATVAATWTISGINPPGIGGVVEVFIQDAADADEAVAVTKYDIRQYNRRYSLQRTLKYRERR